MDAGRAVTCLVCHVFSEVMSADYDCAAEKCSLMMVSFMVHIFYAGLAAWVAYRSLSRG